ncbi:MAG: mevalonate kinase [Legionella sp. 40-6]|nr:mevalonate kinase [Legionella sp.]OJX98484.1 MAG: mevalonate kinase [Legionella sp. 40-6]
MFRTQVSAKCILAGEHYIVHGGTAIVFPFNHYTLTLSHQPAAIKSMRTISGEGGNSLGIMLWPVICKAYEYLDLNPYQLTGYFEINSTIIPCGGLGFSAAICVAVTQWLIYQKLIPASDLFQFARRLEDMFHKKSSGIDILGVLAKNMIHYTAEGEVVPLETNWRPNLYISSSGEQSFTEPCVNKVNEFLRNEPQKAEQVFKKMADSVELIKKALECNSAEQGHELLAEGLHLGNQCFYDWDLVSDKLHTHLEILKKHACAAKVVGAGFGGHVVSLWKQKPPENLPFKLYPLLNE